MFTFLTVVHVIVCVFLMLVVLLQAGRGGGIGLAFGSGGSQSVFGSSGGATFLTKLTATCAIIFFANSLALAYLSSQSDSRRLQKIAEKNALTKKAEEAANSKILTDIDKQRAEKAKAEKSEPGSAPAEEAAEQPADKTAVAKPSTELKLALPDKAKPVGKLSPDLKLGKLDKPGAERAVEKPVGEKKAVTVEPAPPKKKVLVDKATAEKSAEDKAVTDDKPALEKKVAKKAAAEKKAEENAAEKPAAE